MNCPIRKFSLLDKLDSPSLEKLNSHKSYVTYSSGDLLYKEGNKIQGLICLKSGKIKEYKTSSTGNELIVSLKKPVNFIGLADLLIHSSHQSSAMTLETSEICIIEKEDFMQVLNANPLFAVRISEYLSRALTETQTHFLCLTQKHMRGRLAYALLYLYEFFGTRMDDSFIDLRLKRSDLAALTNLTTSNVIRTLGSFVEESLIQTEGRDIKIVDIVKIRHICEIN
ncbi:MAG: Crp/Fnr family transcriptional regulator [Saprospiraceae bacterium]|nr:Crp/Fnr family transcriptional regulator [Saprospiraceae bacterium]